MAEQMSWFFWYEGHRGRLLCQVECGYGHGQEDLLRGGVFDLQNFDTHHETLRAVIVVSLIVSPFPRESTDQGRMTLVGDSWGDT